MEACSMKLHEKHSTRSRADPFGRTDGRTDMTKLTDAFLDLRESAYKGHFFALHGFNTAGM
jgi:hypothetical protein